MSEIGIERDRWLWKDWMPAGQPSAVVGEGGQGKSTLALDLVSRLSLGTLEGEYFGTPKASLLIATEDSLTRVVKPRLLAAGANTDLIYVLGVEGDAFGSVELPTDLARIESVVEAKDIVAILIDPIVDTMPGRTDPYRAHTVRRFLLPIEKMAARTDAAVVMVIHPNKSTGSTVRGRMGMSTAFHDRAKSVIWVSSHPGKDEMKVALLSKSSYSNGGARTFEIEVTPIEANGIRKNATRVVWGDEVAITEGQLLTARPSQPTDRAKARRIIHDLLTVHAQMKWDELVAACETEGLTERTALKARADLQKKGVIEKTWASRNVVVWKMVTAPETTLD